MAVVAVVNPRTDKQGVFHPVTEYVIMNGHCFGYTNAVYNYCRRPLAVRKILQKLFWIATDDYVDDRWALEPKYSIESSYRTTARVLTLLGILTVEDKA